MITTRIGWLLAALLVLSGCYDSTQKGASMAATTHSEWQALENKRVVFGHQSVGGNILNGVKQLAARDGAKVDIQEGKTESAGPGIRHFLIGTNGDPASKIRDFAASIDAGAAQKGDIALMKLCYADFNDDTNARQVAKEYIASLESLAQRHPDINFVAVTAPLTAVQTGPKAWIKRLIGKQPSGYLDNAKRAEFNTLLRQQYLESGRLFDIARAETEPASKYCVVHVDGQDVETLCPELTNDGGHLNDRGQELIANAFVSFISSLGDQVTK